MESNSALKSLLVKMINEYEDYSSEQDTSDFTELNEKTNAWIESSKSFQEYLKNEETIFRPQENCSSGFKLNLNCNSLSKIIEYKQSINPESLRTFEDPNIDKNLLLDTETMYVWEKLEENHYNYIGIVDPNTNQVTNSKKILIQKLKEQPHLKEFYDSIDTSQLEMALPILNIPNFINN